MDLVRHKNVLVKVPPLFPSPSSLPSPPQNPLRSLNPLPLIVPLPPRNLPIPLVEDLHGVVEADPGRDRFHQSEVEDVGQLLGDVPGISRLGQLLSFLDELIPSEAKRMTREEFVGFVVREGRATAISGVDVLNVLSYSFSQYV